MGNDLILHVKKVHFDRIRDGNKTFEYRERTPYWEKRLRGREYDGIQLHCGYPKTGDASRIIRRRWNGFIEEQIVNDHFGERFVQVFSINVSEPFPEPSPQKICPRCGGTKKVSGPFGGPTIFTCVDCDTAIIHSGVINEQFLETRPPIKKRLPDDRPVRFGRASE